MWFFSWKGKGRWFKNRDQEVQWLGLCAMEAKNGRFVGGQRSWIIVDLGTAPIWNKRMNQVGSKGKENNMIFSLRFIIIEWFRGGDNKGFVGNFRGVVSI